MRGNNPTFIQRLKAGLGLIKIEENFAEKFSKTIRDSVQPFYLIDCYIKGRDIGQSNLDAEDAKKLDEAMLSENKTMTTYPGYREIFKEACELRVQAIVKQFSVMPRAQQLAQSPTLIEDETDEDLLS